MLARGRIFSESNKQPEVVGGGGGGGGEEGGEKGGGEGGEKGGVMVRTGWRI